MLVPGHHLTRHTHNRKIQPSGMTKHPWFRPQPLLIVFVKTDKAAEGFDSVYSCMLLPFRYVNMPSVLHGAISV